MSTGLLAKGPVAEKVKILEVTIDGQVWPALSPDETFEGHGHSGIVGLLISPGSASVAWPQASSSSARVNIVGRDGVRVFRIL